MQQLGKPAFYIGWFLIGLLQAYQTELLDDEAYYWVYSQFIDWGYYDHPPVIALLIKAGTSLLPGEAGVRLFMVSMSTLTIAMIHRLTDKKDDPLFYGLSLSILFLQIGGIIAVPDVPVLFFIALYFIILRQFILKRTLGISLLLGLVIALMLYSKYHGLLIVFFTLAAMPKLLLKWQTWTAAILAGLLFFPHILWQFLNGLPSVRYHLFERNATQYKFTFTLEYVLGQIALAGPFIGWLVLTAAFRNKPATPIYRILYWTTFGVFALFLVATFKGRAEANWTAPAYVGLIVMAHQWLTDQPRWRNIVFRLLTPTLVVALIIRIYLMIDMKPLGWVKKDEFHKNHEWATAIQQRADSLPVVFLNSYQRASKYWFYAGDTAFSLNTLQYRRNNYNFWPLEERLQGKRVLVVHDQRNPFFTDSLPNDKRAMFSRLVDSFYSFSQVEINEIGTPVLDKKSFRVLLQADFPTGRKIRTQTRIWLALYGEKNKIAHLLETNLNMENILDASAAGLATIDLSGVPAGTYRYKWGIETCIPGHPSMNSTSKQLVIP